MVIDNIKRIYNGWLVHGCVGPDFNTYRELFVNDDELVEMLTNKENKHKT